MNSAQLPDDPVDPAQPLRLSQAIGNGQNPIRRRPRKNRQDWSCEFQQLPYSEPPMHRFWCPIDWSEWSMPLTQFQVVSGVEI
jgi:hypothetical protein